MNNDGNSSRTWQDIAKELSVELDGQKVSELADELSNKLKQSEHEQKAKGNAG